MWSQQTWVKTFSHLWVRYDIPRWRIREYLWKTKKSIILRVPNSRLWEKPLITQKKTKNLRLILVFQSYFRIRHFRTEYLVTREMKHSRKKCWIHISTLGPNFKEKSQLFWGIFGKSQISFPRILHCKTPLRDELILSLINQKMTSIHIRSWLNDSKTRRPNKVELFNGQLNLELIIFSRKVIRQSHHNFTGCKTGRVQTGWAHLLRVFYSVKMRGNEFWDLPKKKPKNEFFFKIQT